MVMGSGESIRGSSCLKDSANSASSLTQSPLVESTADKKAKVEKELEQTSDKSKSQSYSTAFQICNYNQTCTNMLNRYCPDTAPIDRGCSAQ